MVEKNSKAFRKKCHYSYMKSISEEGNDFRGRLFFKFYVPYGLKQVVSIQKRLWTVARE
jgi:hypothetical protein